MKFRRSQRMSSKEDKAVRSSLKRTAAFSPVILTPGTRTSRHARYRSHPAWEAPRLRAGMEFRRSQRMSSKEDKLSIPFNGDQYIQYGQIMDMKCVSGSASWRCGSFIIIWYGRRNTVRR